jgi:tRNA dimethylallyltransferase
MPESVAKRALLIAGPTASGKSALALKLARQRGGVVINADALQVYGALRIVTARPSPEDEAQAPHRLYGHVDARDAYSVARWLAEASAELETAWDQGLLPIVTGGTGLYFKALEQGIADVPEIDASIRQQWRTFEGDLHAELARRDPAMASRLGPNDRQRIARALEVFAQTGKSLAVFHAEAQSHSALAGTNVQRFYLEVPRAELHRRAEARFLSMLEAGALDEVKRLEGLDPSLPVMKAIGVREVMDLHLGQVSREEAIARAVTATRQFIKRQETWWRGQLKGWTAIDGTPSGSHMAAHGDS